MISASLAIAAVSGPAPIPPVLWFDSRGALTVAGKPTNARLTTGAQLVRTPYGVGLDVNGRSGGLLVPDSPDLALTRSMTVQAWIYLRSLPAEGQQSQIFFRGDDRLGNDPYDLNIHNGGVSFGVGKLSDDGAYVATEIPLRQWVRITASYDDEQHELRLWVGNQLVSTRRTQRKPYAELDTRFSPGIGIGNVQNDRGPHNQPLNGMIVDLRLYPTVIEPREAFRSNDA